MKLSFFSIALIASSMAFAQGDSHNTVKKGHFLIVQDKGNYSATRTLVSGSWSNVHEVLNGRYTGTASHQVFDGNEHSFEPQLGHKFVKVNLRSHRKARSDLLSVPPLDRRIYPYAGKPEVYIVEKQK